MHRFIPVDVFYFTVERLQAVFLNLFILYLREESIFEEMLFRVICMCMYMKVIIISCNRSRWYIWSILGFILGVLYTFSRTYRCQIYVNHSVHVRIRYFSSTIERIRIPRYTDRRT